MEINYEKLSKLSITDLEVLGKMAESLNNDLKSNWEGFDAMENYYNNITQTCVNEIIRRRNVIFGTPPFDE